MSIVTPEAVSTTNRRLIISLFDHPAVNTILHSQDSRHIQVPKTYVTNSSPTLCELIRIRKALDSIATRKLGYPYQVYGHWKVAKSFNAFPRSSFL